ncbi:hypothetical protein CANARDRAFT_215280 [[Candida] arabinofermentans NRRL YB-2248]|uniref:Retroviral polymerase SH3-like domain-containing protein n=1 Tax=[Candida] arabinofermentans NRRL YB-2248 TaxID=983967 RepID=A0A1E4ST12_9ASCO|nr:hypothetical protein CANARDRAFT_215280 [[Candida] arabinofermentans NRRL YB-2248]
MLTGAKLPSAFWPDAALFSVHIRNYIYNDRIKNSPAGYNGFKPKDSNHQHIFGEACAVTIPPYDKKTETRAHIGIHLGYDHSTFGYTVYVPHKRLKLTKGFYEYTRHLNADADDFDDDMLSMDFADQTSPASTDDEYDDPNNDPNDVVVSIYPTDDNDDDYMHSSSETSESDYIESDIEDEDDPALETNSDDEQSDPNYQPSESDESTYSEESIT